MVHQHFMLIPVMTVAENIVLAQEPTRGGVLLDFEAAERGAREISEHVRTRRRPRRARSQDITRRPAAARRDPEGALPRRRDPRPRRADRGADAAGGAGAVRDRAHASPREGKSIIFISHKLNEVLEIADRITVLRRGKLIETLPAAGATEESLARLMVGREVLLRVEKSAAQPGGAAARGRGPPRRRRPRHREGARRLVRGARRRDRRHRRRRRQRADGADRRDDRSAPDRSGYGGASAGEDVTGDERARPLRRGPRPHPRGPAAARARARVLDRREHRAARLPQAARLALRLAVPAAPGRAGARADQASSTCAAAARRRAPAASRAATSRR